MRPYQWEEVMVSKKIKLSTNKNLIIFICYEKTIVK